jgi:hypothetical protein
MAKKSVEKVEAAAVADEVNKSQAIKDLLAKDPDASPKSIAATLSEQGIEVSTNYASNVKSTAKSKGKRKPRAQAKAKTVAKLEAQDEPAPKKRRKVRRKKRRAASPAPEAAAPAAAGDLVALSALLEAKKLVAKLGDLQLAKQAVEALARLTE